MSPRHVFAFAVLIGWLLPAIAVAAGVPLADAAERGDLAAVRSLIAQGIDVNATRVDGTAALHAAVHADHLEIADLLLRSGANAGARDRYGVTPLSLACVNGNAEMIRRLLEAGVDPDSTDPGGETALMCAARTGAVAALRLLIERGAAVDAREPEFQQTALMIAVREDHGAAVELLVKAGAAVNSQTRKGPTPAFVPPCKGTGCGSEGVGINRGGLPDRGRRAEVKGGMTPLLYAARDGRVEPARLLVAAGADLELGDGNSIRPLLMAALNGQITVARLLIERGANVNADDFWGRTPLWAAVEYRNLDMNNRDQDSPINARFWTKGRLGASWRSRAAGRSRLWKPARRSCGTARAQIEPLPVVEPVPSPPGRTSLAVQTSTVVLRRTIPPQRKAHAGDTCTRRRPRRARNGSE
jgi:ankyrin repeat protein